jgi:hypothetical protein
MKRNLPAFPICTETTPLPNDEGFKNVVVGGLTVRDYIAIELLAGMMANPVYVANKVATASSLRAAAIEQADKFVEELGE